MGSIRRFINGRSLEEGEVGEVGKCESVDGRLKGVEVGGNG